METHQHNLRFVTRMESSVVRSISPTGSLLYFQEPLVSVYGQGIDLSGVLVQSCIRSLICPAYGSSSERAQGTGSCSPLRIQN